jgi:hypothetical protein
MPPSPDNIYAQEGTVAHMVLEDCLSTGTLRPKLKKLKKYIPVEMLKHAVDASFKITTWSNEFGIEPITETKVKLPTDKAKAYGTCDVGLVAQFDTLKVIDYKYGAGIPVEATGNPQMIFYALGMCNKHGWNFARIILTIIQPRAPHIKGPVREFELTLSQLLKWQTIFEDAIELALKPKCPAVAGPWCRWCRAESICPAKRNDPMRLDRANNRYTVQSAKADFQPVKTG